MNNIQKSLITASLIANINCIALADDFSDYGVLIGEYVASNPGLEIAVPKFTKVNVGGTVVPDGYNFHFDVFKLGTQIKLFSTTDKYLAFYLGCVDGGGFFGGKLVEFKRIGNGISMQTSFDDANCPATGKISNFSHVYTVDLSAVGKIPWTKSFSGKIIATGVLPDINGNNFHELAVTIETGPSEWNRDNLFYVYDGLTGAAITTPQRYAIER